MAGEAIEQQLCESGYWRCPTDPNGLFYHYCPGPSKIVAKTECEAECLDADCVAFDY